MKLIDYLHERNLTQPQFAQLAGVSQSTVSRWCAGVLPSRRSLQKLRSITGGRITAASFDNLEDEAA